VPAKTEQRQWYKLIEAKAKADDAPKRVVVHVYDTIGADLFFGGVDAAELVAEIEALDDDTELEARINSPGGYAWDGLTIANALMRHPGPTSTYVDGLAASAASIVALAGDTVTISKYGQMMLHNAHGGVYGTAEELKAGAEVLGKLNNSMADFYADRAGGDAADWRRVMSRETWYNAEEAKTAGLATAVDESAKREESEQAVALTLPTAAAYYKYPGREAAPAPTASAADGPSGPDTGGKRVPISEKLAERLGLPADATDDDVNAKLDELEAGKGKADEADPPADAPAGDVPAETGAVEKVAAEAKKLGLAVVPPEKLEQMSTDAAMGKAAYEEMTRRRHTAVLDEAINKGKIVPAQRPHFASLLALDEHGTTKVLAEIPAETAAPMAELGHALEPAAMAGDDIANDPRYQAWKF
jgi:ATP-dependent protease ClpP protease subunit